MVFVKLPRRHPRVAEIVCSWPGEFDISCALALGLAVDEAFADVVRAYAGG